MMEHRRVRVPGRPRAEGNSTERSAHRVVGAAKERRDVCTSVIERIPAAAVADVLSHDLQVQIHLERALHLAQSRTVLPAPLQGGPALSRVERCEHAPGIRKGIHVAVRTSHTRLPHEAERGPIVAFAQKVVDGQPIELLPPQRCVSRRLMRVAQTLQPHAARLQHLCRAKTVVIQFAFGPAELAKKRLDRSARVRTRDQCVVAEPAEPGNEGGHLLALHRFRSVKTDRQRLVSKRGQLISSYKVPVSQWLLTVLTSRRPPVVLQEIVREELCRIRRLRSAERDEAGRECGREGLRHVLLRLLRGGERLDQPVGKEELELAEGRPATTRELKEFLELFRRRC